MDYFADAKRSSGINQELAGCSIRCSIRCSPFIFMFDSSSCVMRVLSCAYLY